MTKADTRRSAAHDVSPSVPEPAEAGVLDRLRYELEVVQEDLVAVRMEQEAALAKGEAIKRLLLMARRSFHLRERQASLRREIALAERVSVADA
jgi:hypothetical protein